MRNAVSLCALSLVLGFAAGCDSEDPAQVESQTMTIGINAVNAAADTYQVWNMIEDSNNDNQPDDGQTYLWCEGPTTGGNLSISPVTAPWSFSVQIDLIRAGSTERTVISSEDASSASYNVANYDTQPGREGQTPTKQPVTVGTQTFKFSGGRLFTAVNQDVLFSRSNPLAALQGNRFGTTCPPGAPTATNRTRCGLCSTANPGPARIDGAVVDGAVVCNSDLPSQCALPYTITLGKGDTLIFQSRIAETASGGQGLDAIRQNPSGLSAIVMVDGRPVTLQGTTTGATLSFSFTSR